MADMILGSAQGAVDSLLGRLTSALVEEAQQLGSVRGDVQFIKDEMESMNGFLMHVVEATGDEGEDHQVRAWMKQVAEVAYSSQNCVDLYVQSLGPVNAARGKGFLAYVRRLPHLVCTLPVRHRIGTQIRELKIRAHEVGERRQRYGVQVPTNGNRAGAEANMVPLQDSRDDDAMEEMEAQRRALVEAMPPPFDFKSHVIQLSHDNLQPLKVFAIVGPGGVGKTTIAKSVWSDQVFMNSFDFRGWICVSVQASAPAPPLLQEILQMVPVPEDQLKGKEEKDEEELLKMLQIRLEGKRFFLVLDDVWDISASSFNKIRSAFSSGNSSPGSAILVTTRSPRIVNSFSPCEDMNTCFNDYLATFFSDNAISLLNSNHHTTDMKPILMDICGKLAAMDFSPWFTPCQIIGEHESTYRECIRLFLHGLCANPDRTIEEFHSLRDNLDYSSSLSYNENQVQKFLYNGLSRNCKNCLLYMTIFPKGKTFRRTRLVRRLVSERVITKRGRLNAVDEAGRCFNVIVAHRLIKPKDTDVTGKVKSYVMPEPIQDFATEIARDEKFVKTNIPLNLAHRLSVHNAVQLPPVQQHVPHSQACWGIWSHFNRRRITELDGSNTTQMFLEILPSVSQFGLLQVLDLEDCKEMKDHHLKKICSNVLQLRYLSIRNTDIAELPKKLDKLQYLETLDIRETKVQAFPNNGAVLPKLKHLFAGQKTNRTSQSCQSAGPIFVLQMPKHIRFSTELQVLSRIKVACGDELSEVGNLFRLRKLGVVLDQAQVLRHFYHVVGKLTRNLRVLSIRFIADKENAEMDMEETLHMPPIYLQTLEISGLNGLPAWVEKLRELTKVTLHRTLLTVGDIKILGKLTSLCFLRLWHETCSEKTLTFSEGEFQSLKYLVIECSDVTVINFGDKAAPKLKKIVWSSTGSQHLRNCATSEPRSAQS